MENEKIFEFMTKMYADLKGDIGKLNDGQQDLKKEIVTIKEDVINIEGEVKKIGAQIDGEISPKIEALFDGYKQNSEQLTRIEKQVSTHDEIIFKRVK